MANNKRQKIAMSDIEMDRKRIENLFAQALAKRYPLFEAGRNVVGFMQMLGKPFADRITDLLRGHSRRMQNDIADSIRIYVMFQEIDLTGVRHVDDELEEIFEMYDNYLTD